MYFNANKNIQLAIILIERMRYQIQTFKKLKVLRTDLSYYLTDFYIMQNSLIINSTGKQEAV